MPCTTVREQLHTLSDGERLANRRETAAVLSHCVRCAECRTYFGQLRRLRHATRHLPQTLAVPATMRGRVLAQLPLPSENVMMSCSPEERHHKLTQGKKQMNRITIATVALVLPIVVGTLATQKQHKPTPESLIKPALKTPRMQAPKETPLPTESQRPGEPNNAAFLARLQELRTKWEVWAREHGEDLAAMLRETGNERAAYDRVLNAMPSQFEYNGNTVLNGADLDVPDLPFVYVPQYQKHTGLWKMPNNIKPYILRDGAEGEFARMRADEELEKKYPSNTRRFIPERDRERFRDIAIVTSFMKSGNAYTLWISGRITEHTPTGIEFTLQSYEHKAIRYSEGEEIVPPYSFLTE